MAAHPANRPATYQDVLDAPENKVAEIVDGELFVQSRPAGPHARAASLYADLNGPFDRGRGGPGGWILLMEPEIHLGENVLVPDIAGWRRERMPKVSSGPFFTLAPDWVCEILSPSTAKLDRAKKLPLYAREAVRFVWLVSPNDRTLEVFQLAEVATWRLVGTWSDDARVRAAPFDAIEVELGALWADVERP